ncbi:MAG: glycosyltransferase family 4 protein [Bacteroidetes bacterium]|nr:glycosyltransferase family 4 protein [Bacteroidota bacterium]
MVTVGVLSDGIWPINVGGIQKHTYYLCKYLSRVKSVRVKLFLILDQEDLIKQLDFDIEIFIVKKYRGVYFPGHYLYKSFQNSKLIVQKFEEEIKCLDLVYAQGLTGWYYCLKKEEGWPKILVNFHGLEMFQVKATFKHALEMTMLKPFFAKVIKESDFVQSLGGHLTLILSMLNPKGEIKELRIGIDSAWTSKEALVSENTPKEKVKFVFIGRYERRKGIEELTSVVKEICQNYTHTEFHFIGPIPKKKRLQCKMVDYYGLVKDSSRIKQVLDSADCLVVPSYSEGLPTVMLEAMASNCVVIASDVGAVKDVLVGDYGVLISPGNKDELKEKIIEISLLDREKLEQLKMKARNRILEYYMWEDVVNDYVNCFNECIS